MEKINHNIPPIYNENSEILILGSFPSVKSREAKFFYNHPQNRFWKVISTLCSKETPISISEKEAFLTENHIALWDTLKSCEIIGSSDSSIRNAVPNDISLILNCADIKQIFCNGATSFSYYNKYIKEKTKREAVKLPSTSPANASFSLEKLISEWQVILTYLSNHQ